LGGGVLSSAGFSLRNQIIDVRLGFVAQGGVDADYGNEKTTVPKSLIYSRRQPADSVDSKNLGELFQKELFAEHV
jgi:hypothetical protein